MTILVLQIPDITLAMLQLLRYVLASLFKLTFVYKKSNSFIQLYYRCYTGYIGAKLSCALLYLDLYVYW